MTTTKTTSAPATTAGAKNDPNTADTSATADNVAQVAFDRAKEAIPSMDAVNDAASGISDYVREHNNVDLQRMADDAAKFVRRNPGTSLAAAAGLGVLIGVLAAKRS